MERLSPEIGLGPQDVEALIDVGFELKTGDPPETKQKSASNIYKQCIHLVTYKSKPAGDAMTQDDNFIAGLDCHAEAASSTVDQPNLAQALVKAKNFPEKGSSL